MRFKLLVMRIKKLISQISYKLSVRQLKRILGPTAVIIGISFTAQIAAQEFADPVRNPFGIDTLDIDKYITPAFGDLDGDGDYDLLGGVGYNEFKYFENIGDVNNPIFTLAVTNPFGLISNTEDYIFPTFADLDNDGDLDLIVSTLASYNENIIYYENIGTDTSPEFTDPVDTPFGLSSVHQFPYPDLVDLDADGDFDLMVGEIEEIYYFENVGTSEFPMFGDPIINPFGLVNVSYFSLLTMGDMDLDGDQDFLKGSNYGQFEYYENIGTITDPSFDLGQENPFGLVPLDYLATPTLVDLDGDGDLDLMSGEYTNLVYFENIAINVATDNQNQVRFSIFPNPASNDLFIQSEESISLVELLDQHGRIINTNSGNSNLDISNLESGMYLLRITSEDGRTSSRKFNVK